MNYIEALNYGTQMLAEQAQAPSPSLDAEVLFRHALGISKEDLISNRFNAVPPAKLERYGGLLKDRKAGVPVAYLTGEKEFYGLRFKVSRHVLIPRPETEALVERAAFELKGRHDLRIIDIATGSGCIIISLAKNLSNNNFYTASDDSARALAVAEENAARHRVKVKFVRSDLTKNTGADYDVVIANLPYLPAASDDSIQHEPKQALVAKKNGLELYERLFKEIADSGRRPWLYLEFGHDQAQAIQRLAQAILPAPEIEFFRDLAGIPRFARIWMKKTPR